MPFVLCALRDHDLFGVGLHVASNDSYLLSVVGCC